MDKTQTHSEAKSADSRYFSNYLKEIDSQPMPRDEEIIFGSNEIEILGKARENLMNFEKNLSGQSLELCKICAAICAFMISDNNGVYTDFKNYPCGDVEGFVKLANLINSKSFEFSDPCLLDFFLAGYQILCEFDFSTEYANTYCEQLLDKIRLNVEKFDNDVKVKIHFVTYYFPQKILKKYLLNNKFKKLLKLPGELAKAESLIESTEAQKDKLVGEFKIMKELWNDIKRDYHFAVLEEGFSGMRARKIKEKDFALDMTICLALAIILIPFIQIFFLVAFSDSNIVKIYLEKIIYIAPPFIALEIFVLYFFRISLSNYKSINAQVLQLDLRIASCQFIKGYSEYRVNVKSDDKNAFDKFESLVFSGIVPAESAIPATFDGMGDLAKLVDAIKSGKRS